MCEFTNTVRACGFLDFEMYGAQKNRKSERNKDRIYYKDMAEGKARKKNKEQG